MRDKGRGGGGKRYRKMGGTQRNVEEENGQGFYYCQGKGKFVEDGGGGEVK